MKIKIKWFTGDKPQFNVELYAGQEEAFLTVKGCRIVSGQSGEFVSWPATKSESSGKWWNHVYASEAFAEAVLAEAKKSKPASGGGYGGWRRQVEVDDDIPFN